MSKNLSSAAQQEFDSLVHHLFQASGRLRECVTLRTGVNADIYKFRTMGKGLANQKASQADVTPMDIAHTLVPCTLENWLAPEYTDIFDQAEVNFDEKTQLARSIAMAMGRRFDQLIIDALDLITPDTVIADGGTGLDIAKIRSAGEALDNAGVCEEGRVIVANTRSKWTLLAQTEATSADYNTVKALAQGQIDTFAGFKYVWIADNGEGGITDAGSRVYNNYAYQIDAVGAAIGIDQRTEINYVPEKTSWLTNGILKAGAVGIDTSGIVQIDCDES